MKFSAAAFLSLYLTSASADEEERRLGFNKRGVCNNKIPAPGAGMTQLLYNAGMAIPDMYPVGSITALIPEAADAAISGATVEDGKSGDTDFPFGNFKPLVTVGEMSVCPGTHGEMIVGVPDGIGAYLKDNKTVRVICQSESYGPLARESYPFPVNDGAATFTGSHVQYVDYDRLRLADFMNNDKSAEDMVKGMGEVITSSYNLKGEPVGPRNLTGATTYGAHFSNTDADGNYVAAAQTTEADWFMQSLCSAHLDEKYQWGEGIGLADDMFITNEEWMSYEADVQAFVGLSAHAIDLATGTDYAVGALTLGGFEKTVEVNPLHTDYVIFSPSGYNGNFGNYQNVIDKRNAAYTRSDNSPYVKPENIVPARVYVGIKGKMEDGSDAPADDFLARNGLRFGKMYGFATDMSANGPTAGVWRDAFHKDTTTAVNGAEVPGVFTPIEWQWTGEVKNFEHDGAWQFQEQPPLHIGTDNYFWNGNGNDASGCKCEHASPDPRAGISGFVQTSTCGYFGHYYLNDIKEILDGLSGTELPGDISATYFMYQGETDVTAQIQLGGKGQYASFNEDGADATMNFDSVTAFKKTFEDIDGFELLEAENGQIYAVIQEDSGNDYGERMFITNALQHSGTPVTYYFAAMSGGPANTRMMAGVGIPAGVNAKADSHEFSGVADMSGLLAKVDKKWVVKASEDGHAKRAADRTVSINDKTIVIGLQSHNFYGGLIGAFRGDRGGQWLAFQPDIPTE
jgi:hypothetical protein